MNLRHCYISLFNNLSHHLLGVSNEIQRLDSISNNCSSIYTTIFLIKGSCTGKRLILVKEKQYKQEICMKEAQRREMLKSGMGGRSYQSSW